VENGQFAIYSQNESFVSHIMQIKFFISILSLITFCLLLTAEGQRMVDKKLLIVSKINKDSLQIIFPVKGGKNYERNFEVFFYKINSNLNEPITDSLRLIGNSDKLIMWVLQDEKVLITPLAKFEKKATEMDIHWSGIIATKDLSDFVYKNGNQDNINQITKTGFQIFVKQSLRNKYVLLESNIFVLNNIP
jgi:hypothetical protein